VLAAWPFTFIFVDWAKVQASRYEGPIGWLSTVLSSGLTGDRLIEMTRWTYVVAGAAALILAAYSLTLPHTPPKRAEEGAREGLAWLEAMKLLKHPFVLILWLVTFVDAFVHNLYFNWTGTFLAKIGIPGNWIMPTMSIGQVAEILTMGILGMTLKRLGWRTTLIIGILGHAARFGVYSFFPTPAIIVAVQILHGICYAFFFATVYIFVDTYFPKDARSSAQGLFNFMILGLGALAANYFGPILQQSIFVDATGSTNYHSLFLVPTLLAIGAAIVLALFFQPPRPEEAEMEIAAAVP
jgi:hypothetical protein